MLGKADFAGQSGLAINSLVEQGSTTLAELNDNYRAARKQVGTLLLSLVKEDIGSSPYKVIVESNGTRRSVVLNQPVQDASGNYYLTNDVAATAMTVDLEDVPDTPSFRMQQMTMLTEVVKSLPPEVQPLLADFMLRATDLPFRHEAADRVSAALGLNGQDNGATTAQQQAAEQQAQLAQQQMQLQLAEQAARVQKAQADAEAARVKIQNMQMQSALKMQETQQKLVFAEDDHAASQDEQAVRLVQGAQASEEDRQQRLLDAQQRIEAHQMQMLAQKQKEKQAGEAHKAKLRNMTKKPQPTR